MRVDLENLSSFSGRVELPQTDRHAQYRSVTQVARLCGVLVQESNFIELSSCRAGQLELAESQLCFGLVVLQAVAPLAMHGLAAEFKSASGVLALSVQAEDGRCANLHLQVGEVAIAGEVSVQGLSVSQGDKVGTLGAAYLQIDNLTVTLGGMALRAPQVLLECLRVGWGSPAGFSLTATRARADKVELLSGSTSASALALDCEGVQVRGSVVAVTAAQASRIEAQTPGPGARASSPLLDASSSDEPRAHDEPVSEYVDRRVLDGLSGRVHADAHVDATFAVVRRRALHALRVAIEDGHIDFLALEHGLSALEDSLLDFSVRNDQLVLELGVPLLPTRGHGKPLLSWLLSPADVERAEQGRARLSVLARPDLPVRQRDLQESEARSALQLHALDVTEIDIDVTLTPLRSFENTVLRALGFARLTIRGELHHHLEDQDDAGQVVVTAEMLSLALANLPVGDKVLGLGSLCIGSIPDITAKMRGALPSHLAIQAENVRLADLELA